MTIIKLEVAKKVVEFKQYGQEYSDFLEVIESGHTVLGELAALPLTDIKKVWQGDYKILDDSIIELARLYRTHKNKAYTTVGSSSSFHSGQYMGIRTATKYMGIDIEGVAIE